MCTLVVLHREGTATVRLRGFRTNAISMILYTEGTRMTGTLLVLYRRRHTVKLVVLYKETTSGTLVLLKRQGSVAEPQQWHCIQKAIRMRGTLSSCTQQLSVCLSVHEQKMRSAEVISIHSAIWLHGSKVLKKTAQAITYK